MINYDANQGAGTIFYVRDNSSLENEKICSTNYSIHILLKSSVRHRNSLLKNNAGAVSKVHKRRTTHIGATVRPSVRPVVMHF